LDNLTYSDDIWLEICDRGLTGYIPAITKTKTIPYIDLLPTERFIPNSGSHEFIDPNKLTIPGALSIVLGISIFLIFPTFSVFAIYLWILGMCLILLKIFCS
jgi:hypothetical protein